MLNLALHTDWEALDHQEAKVSLINLWRDQPRKIIGSTSKTGINLIEDDNNVAYILYY